MYVNNRRFVFRWTAVNSPYGDTLQMDRRTKDAALETRNRILDTAEKVFLKKGVSRTSLENIADAAKLTRGAIYWHFDNKTDLFDAMMERISLPMEEMVERDGELDDPLD